jgi:diacylglycerol kinase family enzyme
LRWSPTATPTATSGGYRCGSRRTPASSSGSTSSPREPWLLPQVGRWLLTGKGQTHSRHVLYVHDADEVLVECDRPTPLQVDGEDLGDVAEARFEAERDALRVLVGR